MLQRYDASSESEFAKAMNEIGQSIEADRLDWLNSVEAELSEKLGISNEEVKEQFTVIHLENESDEQMDMCFVVCKISDLPGGISPDNKPKELLVVAYFLVTGLRSPEDPTTLRIECRRFLPKIDENGELFVEKFSLDNSFSK